jgi:hypothetical protein
MLECAGAALVASSSEARPNVTASILLSNYWLGVLGPELSGRTPLASSSTCLNLILSSVII